MIARALSLPSYTVRTREIGAGLTTIVISAATEDAIRHGIDAAIREGKREGAIVEFNPAVATQDGTWIAVGVSRTLGGIAPAGIKVVPIAAAAVLVLLSADQARTDDLATIAELVCPSRIKHFVSFLGALGLGVFFGALAMFVSRMMSRRPKRYVPADYDPHAMPYGDDPHDHMAADRTWGGR